MLITISTSNKKLGQIPSVSTVPGKDCGNCSYCAKDCYAMKMQRIYPSVKKSWEKNSEVLRKDRDVFFNEVKNYLTFWRPKFFRWHIAGDLKDQDYLNRVSEICAACPDTGFLMFTKMHHLDFSNLPANLSVVASMWPGMPIHENVKTLPKAWMQNGKEDRVPEDAIPCPGICESCGMCWYLPKFGKDVVFHKH